MTKFSEIWVNGTRNADDKAIPWTASTSERSKTYNGCFLNISSNNTYYLVHLNKNSASEIVKQNHVHTTFSRVPNISAEILSVLKIFFSPTLDLRLINFKKCSPTNKFTEQISKTSYSTCPTQGTFLFSFQLQCKRDSVDFQTEIILHLSENISLQISMLSSENKQLGFTIQVQKPFSQFYSCFYSRFKNKISNY